MQTIVDLASILADHTMLALLALAVLSGLAAAAAEWLDGCRRRRAHMRRMRRSNAMFL